MLKIHRKIKYMNYEYYSKNKFMGEITNKIFFKVIKFYEYKVILKSYVNFIFYLTIFITIVCSRNLKLTLLLCIIIFLFRYIWSLYDVSKIYIKNDISQ